MMKTIADLLRSCVPICLLAANSVIAEPLTGQTLGASGTHPILPSTAVVTGDAVEFSSLVNLTILDIDFLEWGQVLVTRRDALGPGIPGNVALTFSDVNATIPEIVGFKLFDAFGISGMTQSDLSFTADSVTMQLGDTTWGSSSQLVAQVIFAEGKVPEPATLALLGVGLAAIGAVRRRKVLRLG
jgi:hypothetical protein